MKYLLGDIHANKEFFEKLIRQIESGQGELTRDDIVFLLGDVGLQYAGGYAHGLKQAMRNLDATIFVIRGNHDARYVRELKRQGNAKKIEWNGGEAWFETDSPNILYAPDGGGFYTIDGEGFLVIPGGYSIDKCYRLEENLPFEPEELLTEEERARIIELAKANKVDYVLSHTCPKKWEGDLRHLFMPYVTQDQVDKTMEFMMDDVLGIAGGGLKGWFFGHYHDDLTVGGGVGHMLHKKYMVL